MDKLVFLEEPIAEIQELFFDILNVVYDSEYPVTLETIAYLTKRPITLKLANAVDALVLSAHIQILIREGSVNYQKPATPPSTLLPLPYHRMFNAF